MTSGKTQTFTTSTFATVINSHPGDMAPKCEETTNYELYHRVSIWNMKYEPDFLLIGYGKMLVMEFCRTFIMFHCCFTLSLVLKPIFKTCQLYILAWPCIAMTIQQVAAMTMSKISFSGCGDGIVRGVNLGGWLVLEPWITPRFFEEVKYQISEGININVCSKHLFALAG